MKYNLRVITGGESASGNDDVTGGFSPDQALFDLLDEARKLEAQDRLFNKRLEKAVALSVARKGGDEGSAWNSDVVRAMNDSHQPVVDRLNELPDLIAATPAYTRQGIVEKLRYLASLLEDVEADIADSVIEDIEHQR